MIGVLERGVEGVRAGGKRPGLADQGKGGG